MLSPQEVEENSITVFHTKGLSLSFCSCLGRTLPFQEIHPILSIPVATALIKLAFISSGPRMTKSHNADLCSTLQMNKTVSDLQEYTKLPRLSLALPQYPPFPTNILPTVGSLGPGPLCRLNHTIGLRTIRDLKKEALLANLNITVFPPISH